MNKYEQRLDKYLQKLIYTMKMVEKDKEELMETDVYDYDELEFLLIDLFVRSNDLKESVVKALTRVRHERKKEL